MRFYIFFLLFVVSILSSCSGNKKTHLHEKYNGIYIDHSMRQGSLFNDSIGNEFMYFYVKAVITNDSMIPAYVKLNIPKGFYQPTPSDSEKFQVFLLPDSISTGQWSENTGLSEELKKFLSSQLDKPITLNKVLRRNEDCVVNIGVITESKYKLNPYMSIFSRGHKPHPWPRKEKIHSLDLSDSLLAIPDSAIQNALTNGNQFSYYLGICFYNVDPFHPQESKGNPYCIIPCGQVSFSN